MENSFSSPPNEVEKIVLTFYRNFFISSIAGYIKVSLVWIGLKDCSNVFLPTNGILCKSQFLK